MYTRIIVAVDITERAQARALLDSAFTLLDAGGEIRLLHVLEEVPGYLSVNLPTDLNEKRRAEAMVELRALIDPADDIRITPELRRGPAAGQILQAATDYTADLIMIASHKPGLQDYLIGSTAGRVIRHAACSVLVKRQDPGRKGTLMYKSIVIGAALFNEGATTRAALTQAHTLLDDGGTVTLVHVIDEVPGYVAASIPKEHMTARRRDVEDQLASIASEAKGITVQTVVREGQPSAAILGAAKEAGADLIMIASHKPGFSDYFIGSTAARVVRHAPVSVLVTR